MKTSALKVTVQSKKGASVTWMISKPEELFDLLIDLGSNQRLVIEKVQREVKSEEATPRSKATN